MSNKFTFTLAKSSRNAQRMMSRIRKHTGGGEDFFQASDSVQDSATEISLTGIQMSTVTRTTRHHDAVTPDDPRCLSKYALPQLPARIRQILYPAIPEDEHLISRDFAACPLFGPGAKCDCHGREIPISQCPHLKNEHLAGFLFSLDLRLQQLDSIIYGDFESLNPKVARSCHSTSGGKKPVLVWDDGRVCLPKCYEPLVEIAIDVKRQLFERIILLLDADKSCASSRHQAVCRQANSQDAALPPASPAPPPDNNPPSERSGLLASTVAVPNGSASAFDLYPPGAAPEATANGQLPQEMCIPQSVYENCHLYKAIIKAFKISDLSRVSDETGVILADLPLDNPREAKSERSCDTFVKINSCLSGLHRGRPYDVGNLCVNLSLGCNVLLVVLKIAAYALSLSMSVLASMIDSCLDIFSGLVLFVCSRLAASGLKKGESITEMADPDQKLLNYPVGKRRYECIGVLAFAIVMGTLALVLIYESVMNIVSLAKQAVVEKPTVFDTMQIVIIALTIVLKLLLCILCHLGARHSKTCPDSCIAYRDDHRNDVLSNSVGFVTGYVGANFYGQQGKPNLSYIDPVGSLLLSGYILINWARAALDQIKTMVGKSISDVEVSGYALRAAHFDPRIERISTIIGYLNGKECTIDLQIYLPNSMTIDQCHAIVDKLQIEFEQIDGVERCYVHIESRECFMKYIDPSANSLDELGSSS